MSLVSGIQYSTEITGRRNAIINGDFDIWQRGTSHSTTGYGSMDRWSLWHDGSTTQSVSQQTFTLGQTDVPNSPKYYVNNVVTSGDLTNSVAEFYQHIESVLTFAGEVVTLTFWAKATAASKKLGVVFIQQFGTGGSPSTQVITEADINTLTTSWAKYTVTVTLPSITGKTLGTNNDDRLAFGFIADAGSASVYTNMASGIGNQDITYDVAQVQLEKGDTATDFEKRSVAEELVLCQRYYERFDSTAANYDRFGVGQMDSTTTGYAVVHFKTLKRDIPAFTSSAASTFIFFSAGSIKTMTGITLNVGNENMASIGMTGISTAGTAGHAGELCRDNVDTSWMAFDAELT